jgi:hypothetical protein
MVFAIMMLFVLDKLENECIYFLGCSKDLPCCYLLSLSMGMQLICCFASLVEIHWKILADNDIDFQDDSPRS